MGDQFEKFIQAHKNEFDEEPQLQEGLRWKQIESRIPSGTNTKSLIWKVAAALFMISTLWLLIDRIEPDLFTEESIALEEFRQAEAFYTSLIDQKRNELMTYDQDLLTEQFLVDVERLDSMYVKLRETYQTAANDEKVLDAMINNLQLRIDILSQQLTILNTLKQSENETFETI